MKKRLLIALFACGICTSAVAQKKSYAESVRELIEVSGSEKIFEVMIPELFAMFREYFPDVPEEYWNAAEVEMSHTAMTGLTDMLVPVYEKYLDQKDLEAMIRFHRSPVGRKIAKHQADITMESMQIGQEWGTNIGMQIANKLAGDGYSVPGTDTYGDDGYEEEAAGILPPAPEPAKDSFCAE